MPALYRTYRPQIFADLVGQEAVVEVLSHAVAKGVVAHGYLFAGPRGSGKTSSARLLAKAVNCTGKTPPCNACAICVDITAGRDFDVIEIDAASHRGIEEMRELRDKVRFPPNRAKYKVYIIDEVHMLTKEAFNALLKTLEEPPAHVIFILATTEAHKVPATIISRVQRFDFRRATIDELTKVLMRVAKAEHMKLDQDAAAQISMFAEGSFRDALALLDQVSAGRATTITKVDILKIFGVASGESVDRFAKALIEKKPAVAITIVNELYGQGTDLGAFINLVVAYLRQRMLEKMELGLAKTIEELLNASAHLKYAPIPQIPLELAIVRITGTVAPGEYVNVDSPKQTKPLKRYDEPIDADRWRILIDTLKPHNHSLAALIASCSGELAGTELIVYVKFKFHKDKILEAGNRAIIEKAV
ncbi:DNA polymerase III subunit gamma/tau, partial [Candidatus Berkelbacteria bacterium]|nr:DNA polymerase III subunit gamma/tau [Candidatus Berkelbacteria bacterium]